MIYLVAPFATATLPDNIPENVLQLFYDRGYQVATRAEYEKAQRLIDVADENAASRR